MIIEALAELVHQQWAAWMQHILSLCQMNPDGSATLPAWAVERWLRQANTEYFSLPAHEKESNRAEARKVLTIIEKSQIELIDIAERRARMSRKPGAPEPKPE